MKKSTLYLVTYISVFVFFVLLIGLIFVPAGDFEFTLGWLYWSSFCIPTLFITVYFLKKNPALIERRVMPTETRPKQIIGQSVAALLFGGIIVIPAVDHRMGWTAVPFTVAILSDIGVVAGFFVVFEVFRENAFASRAIETMEEQKVIKTGLYAIVRHPMYSGASLIIIATPLALNSLSGITISATLLAIIIFRLLDEEKMLSKELAGYEEYCKETKYRLIPHIW